MQVTVVDDSNPIEAGRLSDGSLDVHFRGFYWRNSEVGSKTLLLRASICVPSA
jgi:hypothetical protein